MTFSTANKTQALLDRLGDQLRDWRILELGPYNGRNTKVLAPFCREIVAAEARPENCNLVTELGLPNVSVIQADAESESQMQSLGRFDLIFHCGVLYHLRQPIQHLRVVSALSDRLWLNTHYSRDPRGRRHREPAKHPRAGIHRFSRWLSRKELLGTLLRLGFTSVEVVAECREPNGPRIAIYAERK